MATGDLIPQLLADIFNRAIPDPLDDNEPLQMITAPFDTIDLTDTIVTSNAQGPFLYGVGHYAAATYNQPQ